MLLQSSTLIDFDDSVIAADWVTQRPALTCDEFPGRVSPKLRQRAIPIRTHHVDKNLYVF